MRDFVKSEALPGSMVDLPTMPWQLVSKQSSGAGGVTWLAVTVNGEQRRCIAEQQLQHDERLMSVRWPLDTLKSTCECQGRPLPEGCKSL